MKRTLLYITIALSIASCTNIITDIDPNTTTPRNEIGCVSQTTLVYMSGTSLSYFFGNNIDAMKIAISKGVLGSEGRLLIFKHIDPRSAELYEIYFENGECKTYNIANFSDIVSLEPTSITAVINKAKKFAPATTMNLIVSGHGTGWVPKSRPSLKAAGMSAVSQHGCIWESTGSDVVTRFMGSSQDGYLDISEFRQALDATNTKFGYILFDECFMSSIELLYDLKDACDYIIASPCEIMGDGFPYNTVLGSLFTEDGASNDLIEVCDKYVKHYESLSSYQSACIALTKCSEIDRLAEIVREIYKGETTSVNANTLQYYEALADHVFYDFGQYINIIASSNSELLNQFNTQFDKTFPEAARRYTESFYSNIGWRGFIDVDYYSGVTTSAPCEHLQSDWSESNWAKNLE